MGNIKELSLNEIMNVSGGASGRNDQCERIVELRCGEGGAGVGFGCERIIVVRCNGL